MHSRLGQVLQHLVDEMERQDKEGRSEPRLVVVLDELADQVQMSRQTMEEAITRLTQRSLVPSRVLKR